MKKVYLLLTALVGIATVSNAQLEKGNVLVGGDIANFNLGLDNGSPIDIRIVPKAAWFINNNVAVGGYVLFGLSKSKGYSATTDYGVGALARYYVNDPKLNLLNHGRFFAEGSAGIQGTSYSGSSTNGLGLGIGPGYAYFITPNIGLETLLKFNGIVGFGNAVTSNALNLNVGFQIYLPGKATRDRVMSQERK